MPSRGSCCSAAPPRTPRAACCSSGLAAFGLGFGLTVTPRSTAAVESLGPRLYGMASAAVTVARMAGMAVGLAVLTASARSRIETLSVVITDQAARDAVLPPELQGRPLADPLVIGVLETWASTQAASILAGLFLVAALVLMVAIVPHPDAASPHASRRTCHHARS